MIEIQKAFNTCVSKISIYIGSCNNNRGTEERWSSFVMFVNHSMIHWYCGRGWNKIAFNNNNNNLLILISEQVKKYLKRVYKIFINLQLT